MSHRATSWLSEVPPDALSNSEFRVLFHLCDCHNPSKGCFPTQAYLADRSNVSNGTLNNALNGLEAKGLIERHRSIDKSSKRKRPTRYILGFELKKPQEPSPETGDGKSPKPSPKSGDGAISNLDPDPSPISGQSHLQPTGDKPVKEPVINRAGARDIAEFWSNQITANRHITASAITLETAREMLKRGLVSKEQLIERDIKF